MVTVEDVATRIHAELRGKAQRDVVLDRDSVLEQVGLSSLQIADVVFGLEEDHDIALDESRAADIKTIGQLVDLANETLAATSAADVEA